MQFNLCYHLKLSLDFDKMDFLQFTWYYDRLIKEKQKENTDTGGFNNLIDDIKEGRFKKT